MCVWVFKEESCSCLSMRQNKTWFGKSCKWNCLAWINALIWYVCMEHALTKFKFLTLDCSRNENLSLMHWILDVMQSWRALYRVNMSMNGVPRMMVWLISFVTIKNDVTQMPLLNTKVYVLPTICHFGIVLSWKLFKNVL